MTAFPEAHGCVKEGCKSEQMHSLLGRRKEGMAIWWAATADIHVLHYSSCSAQSPLLGEGLQLKVSES